MMRVTGFSASLDNSVSLKAAAARPSDGMSGPQNQSSFNLSGNTADSDSASEGKGDVTSGVAEFSSHLINALLPRSGDSWPPEGLAAPNDTRIATTQLIVLFENF